ncbi:hypothetical protein MtrunA17_Chr3g0077401 [Medicago truncatula]|uniref:Uncharacterized protein n=1 Tax=Medicago truncatula TaxID=3880 RepID=A0A396ILJ1_MEDTR|nr:hypothetical protein MtrunA17_Chr3g0077401 [Medicago truncatula]
MVNRLSHARFEHKSLKTTFKKILNSESQHIIELVLCFIKKTMFEHSPQKCFTFKDPTRVLLIQCQKCPSIVTDTAKSILNPPKLALAAKTVLSDELQLSIQTFLLIWTTWLLESFAIVTVKRNVNHVCSPPVCLRP